MGCTPALTIENIEVIYNHSVQVLRGLSLEVPEGRSSRCSAPTAPARRRR